ncbi:MAG: hypothetical protein KDK41_09830 [Leptospiraceae bacterium]|nr:hypothetical protein [Leptospiraceae bacterium]
MANCSPGRDGFQVLQPESDTKLTALLNETPALRAAFGNIDPIQFNQKLTDMVHAHPNVAVRFFEALAVLSKDRPVLPQVLDHLAYDIGQLTDYYATNRDDLDRAMDVGSRVLSVDASTMTDSTTLFAEIVKWAGERDAIFSDSLNTTIYSTPPNNKFPTSGLWKNCNDQENLFSDAKPVNMEDGREALFTIYDALRLGYCIYEGGIDPSSTEPGAFMREALSSIKDSGDVELRMSNMIRTMSEESSEIQSLEQELADWLTRDPDKVAITDFLVERVYSITRKPFVFENGKPLLDLQAPHLSYLNPAADASGADDKYLFQWLLKAVYADSAKFDELENYSPIDTTSRLYKFGEDLITDATFGLRELFKSGGSSGTYSQTMLNNLLWQGWDYNGVGGDTSFKGILFRNTGVPNLAADGYVARMAQVSSSQTAYNSYRAQKNTALGSLMNVSQNYNGESMLSGIAKNLYLHLMERYYDQTTFTDSNGVLKPRGWALSSEDAQTWFGDPERNLPGYIANIQYALRNMMFLNPCGKASGAACPGIAGAGSDYSRTPFLTAMLYMLAAANGVVDKTNGPASLTLRNSLSSMQANINPANGIRTIEVSLFGISLPDMQVRVACPVESLNPGDCAQTVWRNNIPATTNMNMFDFELVSPGRFKRREGAITGDWQGNFRSQQGDVETTKTKTANWVMAEIALSAWQGYGPYTVNGKAPNGSNLKYQNDYYTDKYRTLLCTDATGLGAPSDSCMSEHTSSNAMGGNNGVANDGTAGSGNYHIYEKIYIPRTSSDPCWADSTAGGSYPKFGYIRPQGSTSYHINANCSVWTKIQTDFTTLEEATRANLEWLLRDKKYIFVIPMYGVTNMNTGFNNGASFSVFATINANGVYGVTSAKRSGSTADKNGVWALSGVTMNANGDGYINNVGNGFISESNAEGASKTVRYGVTSYTGGDYTVILDLTLTDWGLASVLVDVYEEIWNTLGDGPVTPAIIGNNFSPLLAMAEEKYTTSDLMTNPGDAAVESIAKFAKFYNEFFPDNVSTCTTGTVTYTANGNPDLFENFQNGCITAEDLPPVPKVNGVRYPATFNTDGSIATWYTYNAPSESKFAGFLLPLVMTIGTIHEDGGVRKTNGALLSAGENRDNVTIRNFESDGFREHIDTMLDLFCALNESKKSNPAGSALADNLPAYNTTAGQEALSNLLIEKSKGARNGFLPKLVANRYANVANLQPLVDDIEELISKTATGMLDQFETTKDTSVTTANASGIPNKDKLRYFMTRKVIDETVFTTNYLGGGMASAEPIEQLISFLGYIRSLTDDAEIRATIKESIPVLNKYIEMNGLGTPLTVTDEDIDKVIDFLADQTETGEYTIDGFLRLVVDLKLNDIDTLREFKFDTFKNVGSGRFKTELENMNSKMAQYFGTDYKKKLLFSPFMLGEPVCPGGSGVGYVDSNENGKWDRGIMSFVNPAYHENQTYSETPTTGSCSAITVNVPDIYEPNFYVLNLDNAVWYLNDAILNFQGSCNTGVDPDCSERLYVLNLTNDLYAFNYSAKIIEIKNDILGWLYDREITLTANDRNGNNVIESGEFSDVCNNGIYQSKTTLRNFIRYYISGGTPDCAGSSNIAKSQFQSLYEDISDSTHGGYLLVMNQAMDELFNPNCHITYAADCYKTERLLDVQRRFYAATDFEPAELKAFKNFVGVSLYDHAQDKYTYPISGMASQLAILMTEFQGNYPELLEMSITGFATDGFLTYMTTAFSGTNVDSYEVLRDMRTFVNTRPVREYNNPETFWWQLSGLMSSIADAAYHRHNMSWRNDYYNGVSAMFRE